MKKIDVKRIAPYTNEEASFQTREANFSAMSLHILFLDFNSFFASVEQTLDPSLRGRPVAVVPVKAESTSCIAASYEAKQFGVKTGTPVHEARRLCPGIVVIEARPRAYIRYHKQLVELVDSMLPVGTVHSVDEVHCQLWGRWHKPEPAMQLAREIKRTIAREAGMNLTCSIGLAPNVFLAKTASNMQKPDGLVMIRPEDLPHCLHGLELRDFCGIGSNMEARLRRQGIHTAEALCAASKEQLRAAWGSIEGDRFHANLRGEEVERPATRRQTLGHSHVLPPELRSERGARAVLHRLIQKAAMRLRSQRLLTGGLHWSIHYGCDRTWRDEIVFAHTDDTLRLVRALDQLWERRLPHGVSPTSVGVTFFDLLTEENYTPSLFEQVETSRDHALMRAVDQINHDWGHNSVYCGGAHEALHYAPMRIAFNRIPDPECEG